MKNLLIVTAMVLASSQAYAAKSVLTSIACTASTIAMTISSGDSVAASSVTLSGLSLKASTSSTWTTLSSSSSVAQGSGNSLTITLDSGERPAGIASGCDVKLTSAFNTNLEERSDAIRSE